MAVSMGMTISQYRERGQSENSPLQALLIMANKRHRVSKSSSEEGLRKFIKDCRNYLAHAQHQTDLIQKSYKTLLDQLGEEGGFNRMLDFPSREYHFKTLWDRDRDANIQEYLKRTRTEDPKEPTLFFIALILSLYLPPLWIDKLCDDLGIPPDFPVPFLNRKSLITLAKRNVQQQEIDLSFLNWALRGKTSPQVNQIQNWNQAFLRHSWSRLLREREKEGQTFRIDGQDYKVDPSSTTIMASLACIRFKATKGVEVRGFQISQNFLQQLYYYRYTGKEVKEWHTTPKRRKESSPPSDLQKLYSYLKAWEEKKTWVKEAPSKENGYSHRAIKSLTRYLIRELRSPQFTKTGGNEEAGYKRRDAYLRLFKSIQSYLDIQWAQGKDINLAEIPLPSSFRPGWKEKRIKDPAPAPFPEYYRAICDCQLKKLGKWEGMFREFEKQEKVFKDYFQGSPSKGQGGPSNRSLREVWGDLKNKPGIPGRVHSKDTWTPLTLPSSHLNRPLKNPSYLDTKVLSSLIEYIREYSLFLENEDLCQPLEILKGIIEKSQEGQPSLTREEKRAKKEGYRALELALLVCPLPEKDYSSLERLTFKEGTTGGGIYKRLHRGFYCLPGSDIDVFFQELEKKEEKLRILESYRAKSQAEEKYKTAFHTAFEGSQWTHKGHTFYFLDNTFMKELVAFYLKSMKEIIQWESGSLQSLKLKFKGYSSFLCLLKEAGVPEERRESLCSMRNALFHFKPIPLKEVSDQVNFLRKWALKK